MTSPPSPQSSDTSFPILILSILGILATFILLLSYYIFVTKCCITRRQRNPISFHPTAIHNRGLPEPTIQAIPTFRFRPSHELKAKKECPVCLTEFQEQERLRLLPTCFHVFHIDCIDTWLQASANCPLCRKEVAATPHLVPANQFTALSLSPAVQIDQEKRKKKQKRSMGDECIDVREIDEEFRVEAMRRSFSMDASRGKELCLMVQRISREDVAGDRRRPFFLLGRCQGSQGAVLPV